MPAPGPDPKPRLRALWFVLGWIMTALGLIGAVLPLMPTTVFLVLAAWCFGRSSPRLEAWLLAHPRVGPVLRDWRQHGAVPRRAKIAAVAGMTLGYGGFYLGAKPGPLLAGLVAIAMLACAAWMITRPEGR